MKRIWILVLGALLATTVAMAQQQPDNDSAKSDMKSAGHNTKEAAKDVAQGTKKVAVKVGHATKHAAVATKNAVTGDDDRANETAEQRETRERAETRNRNLPQSDRNAREEALERSVQIVNGPDVDAGHRSATIRWTTNKTAASDVWLTGGGIRGHRTSYVRGGSRDHRVMFSNLRPNTTYNFAIRTREGEVRKEGSFTTR